MLVWIDAFYKTHKIYNSKLAEEETGQASKKPVKKLSVTAKKGTKNIKIQTIKKRVIKPAQNKTGKVNTRLSKPLKKGIKVTVKVSKKGYKTKTKVIKVK